ncbi:MAG: exodeoxyribonuclease VII small subunit [Coxiellaceae bacterium]|nr:exodeoxyribonuclease VII small subunit [Coxiellaceae bacterium]
MSPKETIKAAAIKKPNLEKDLAALETLIEQMECGDISLDQSLKHFEKGVKLVKQCQQALTDTEQKVKILIDNHLQDFDDDATDG